MRLGRLGLFELITSLAALYVCIGTTPAGELTKRTLAWATGWEHEQRPLTGFFSGTETASASSPEAKVRPFSQMKGLWRQVQRSSRDTGLDAALVMATTIVLGEGHPWPDRVRQELRDAKVDLSGDDALARALRHYHQGLGSESA
ncbi:MAG: hypothetical protein JRF33_20670, partial [Deltaproteobacteria bacterium]|nr:hypothetical protein [Deltaproteobacteria bacterium]